MADSIQSLRFSITKRYGAKTVLAGLPLEIKGREFVTFLGPSGCGKSTALGIVAGLIPPTEGEIFLDGQRIEHLLPEKRGFGMVFQNYALFAHLTVFDNVAFGLSLQRRPADEIKRRVLEMLGLVRLAGYEERYPGQLSGGQQQRVAIARALVLHPRLMLFDEPLSNLDAKLRVEMRTEIKQLHTRLGLTSIYVTHDQAEALSLSDRIVVLREGVLMQVGTPQEIHDRPKNVFVADFMGFRNFFDVDLRQTSAGFVEGVGKGMTLRARASEIVGGSAAVMAIRPEDVRFGGAADDANVLRGKVELVEYLGREQESAIVIEGGQRIWVRTTDKVSVGDTVAVTLPPDKLVLLPREG
ncbi:MAG: ABC transporter ATP-binding protein [Rhizobiales bacterium]|nr:ABC transporter ATP-binding protein [Hyphomicrobiales bacterium]